MAVHSGYCSIAPATVRSLRLLVHVAVGLTLGPLLGLVGAVLTVLVRSDGIGLVVLVVVLLAGLGCLVAGPLLWIVLPSGAGQLLAAYLGLFGALFLRYAVVA